MRSLSPIHRLWVLVVLSITPFILSGCGLLGLGSFGPEPTPEPPPAEERAIMPTFTPTADAPQPTPTEPLPPPTLPPVEEPVSDDQAEVAEEANDAVNEETTTAETEPTATPLPNAQFTVTQPVVNVRSGPGTNYGLAGSADAGQSFEIQGRNAAGDWWQICCVNGQQVWVFGQLGDAANTEQIAVAQNIPPSPTPAPVVVAPTPVPQPTQPPAPTDPPPPPPAADPCAGIGGDGCKFRVRDGPKFAQNGGLELKLQLFFIHSGVDGGQPQGSYFVVLTKDGQNLGVSDAVRSIANNASQGALGRYNYEYKIGLDKLPGNTVAGNYTMFVLDGNGERDSQDLNFSVPEGQGEVWVTWDQG